MDSPRYGVLAHSHPVVAHTAHTPPLGQLLPHLSLPPHPMQVLGEIKDPGSEVLHNQVGPAKCI